MSLKARQKYLKFRERSLSALGVRLRPRSVATDVSFGLPQHRRPQPKPTQPPVFCFSFGIPFFPFVRATRTPRQTDSRTVRTITLLPSQGFAIEIATT